MAIIFPTLNIAKELAKRSFCLNNLKQLSLAWIMYANQNEQRIVSGIAGSESGWIGKAYHDDFDQGVFLSEEEQKAAIRAGTLWDYIKEEGVYKCPMGRKDQEATYAIIDSMNGCTIGRDHGSPFVSNKMSINKPSERMVFIDEGWITPDSFAVHYIKELWWDDPPVRHSKGVTISFADGSSNYHKWKGTDTIINGKKIETNNIDGWPPETDDGKKDLHWLQKGCWGKLGYTPTVWY